MTQPIAVVFTYYVDGEPRPQAVTDSEGRVRVWHSRANRYGWADLFVTWDGGLVDGPAAAEEWASRPVTLGDLSDALAGAVDAIRQHVDDKMAPAAKRDDRPAPEDAPTQDEGVEPGPRDDDQSTGPVPSLAWLEAFDTEERRRSAASPVPPSLDARFDLVHRRTGVVAAEFLRLTGHITALRLRVAQLEHDLREATQREGL